MTSPGWPHEWGATLGWNWGFRIQASPRSAAHSLLSDTASLPSGTFLHLKSVPYRCPASFSNYIKLTRPTNGIKTGLLLLSHVSRVRLCVTPQTAAYQGPPSLGFSRQEHCSGLPFPSPMHESEKWKWSHSVMSDSATPWTAAHQAPPSMGFSRQEYWSGLPLPSSQKWAIKHVA